MKGMEELYIAGVQFKIQTTRISLPMPVYENPGYRQFFSQIPSYTPTHSLDVAINLESGPDISRMNQIFKNTDTWSVFSNSKENFIVYEIPSFSRPVWIARVSNGCMKVIIYCGQDMIDKKQHCLKFNPVSYPLDQILMMNFLALNCGIIIHAAGWEFNNSGWIFAGKSGAGKSTITNLITKRGHGRILSDDRMIVRKHGHDFLMYGTPWPGEAGYALNQSAPLKGLFFLKQGDKNNIAQLESSDVVAQLMPVASISWYDRDKVEQMMAFCDTMIANIPMYLLTFKPDEAVVDMLIEFVNE